MINPFDQWVSVSDAGLRALSQIGITTHWLILQYSIGLFTIVVGFEMLHYLTHNKNYLEISKSLSKVAIVIFAAGAATGSSGEFGLLLFWPGFLELAGKYFFTPFYLELFAFFAEVIFVYLYYYTWDKVTPRFHIFLGIMGVMGLFASALLIMTANTLMGFPPGIQSTYNPATGQVTDPTFVLTVPEGGTQVFTSTQIHQLIAADPDRFQAILGATLRQEGIFGLVFTGPAVIPSFLHAIFSAILVTIFTVIGVYSYRYIHQPEEKKRYYRDGLKILSFYALFYFFLQAIVGHFLAEDIAMYNPEKLAALEGTSTQIFGLSDLPLIGPFIEKFVSFLAFGGFDTKLPNYDSIATDHQVPIIIHYMYYTKMLLTAGLALNIFIFSLFYIKRQTNPPNWFIKVNYASPVFINLISLLGWAVREIGRKPYTIYGMLTVNDAARPTPVPLVVIVGVFVYAFLLLGGLVFVVWYLFHIPSDTEEKIEIDPIDDIDETATVSDDSTEEPEDEEREVILVEGGDD